MIITSTGKRRFIIPDIHGCSKTFIRLVERIKLKKEDQLFLLGDYIDRGKNSAVVLDFIIDLIKRGYQIYPLRGNHEQNMLNAMEQYNYMMRMFYSRRMNTMDLLGRNNQLKTEYDVFLNHLPYYIELDKYYLVHGGFDTKNKPFSNKKAMLTIRNMMYNAKIYKGKSIIFGHNPLSLEAIENAISSESKLIPLDNGCVYAGNNVFVKDRNMGNLVAFHVEKRNLLVQENID